MLSSSARMASAKASTVLASAQSAWSREKMLRTKARSMGRRLLAMNSGSFLRRCSSVGAPSPVQTKASSASRDTRSGWFCANSAARSAPLLMP